MDVTSPQHKNKIESTLHYIHGRVCVDSLMSSIGLLVSALCHGGLHHLIHPVLNCWYSRISWLCLDAALQHVHKIFFLVWVWYYHFHACCNGWGGPLFPAWWVWTHSHPPLLATSFLAVSGAFVHFSINTWFFFACWSPGPSTRQSQHVMLPAHSTCSWVSSLAMQMCDCMVANHE